MVWWLLYFVAGFVGVEALKEIRHRRRGRREAERWYLDMCKRMGVEPEEDR